MTTTTLNPLHPQTIQVPRRVIRVTALSAVRLTQLVAIVGSLCAAALLAYTVLALPNRLMLSDYVHVTGGLEPFVGGLLALAVATFAVARLVAAHGGPASVVLRVCATATVMTAAFPTDTARVSVMSLSGQIHRYAAFVVFVGLPVAGWLLVRGSAAAPARVVRWIVRVSAFVTAMTVLLHPLSPVAELVGQPGWEGGFERMLAAADVVLVGAIAAASDRVGTSQPTRPA
jgi:hypothetical protein